MSDTNQGQRLGNPACLAFPFRVTAAGPATSRRSAHVREQIEQVLFTLPGERVFRPEFGGGVAALVFEPNDAPLAEVTRRRILAALAEALRGEVDASSVDVEIEAEGERLGIVVRYRLAAIGVTQSQRFELGGGLG